MTRGGLGLGSGHRRGGGFIGSIHCSANCPGFNGGWTIGMRPCSGGLTFGGGHRTGVGTLGSGNRGGGFGSGN
jgi:hypothetical protein